MSVRTRDAIAAVDLLGPPAQRGETILDGSDRERGALPMTDERIDVFWFERAGRHSAKPQLVKLIGDRAAGARETKAVSAARRRRPTIRPNRFP